MVIRGHKTVMVWLRERLEMALTSILEPLSLSQRHEDQQCRVASAHPSLILDRLTANADRLGPINDQIVG